MRGRVPLRRFGAALLLPVAVAAAFYAFCPRPDLYGGTPFSSAVHDRHGTLLRLNLADDERYRLFVPLADIASSVQDATLKYEDRHYRQHPGINPAALVRAAWSTWVTGDRVIGGSTITMQLARLVFDIKTRQWDGKLIQILRALQLERHYGKDEILEAYLNLAPYGGNVEGVGTAALIYFDKPASALSLPEALALAVIPQNPVARNPATARGYAAMMAARSRLFDAWRESIGAGGETVAMFDLPLAVRAPAELPYRAPHFSRAFMAQRREAGAWTSSLDLATQQLLEQQLTSYIARQANKGLTNAAAILVDHRTMEIRALVGSADFFDDRIAGQVDGTRAKRSPGSALKPFIYGLALEQGLIHPMTLLKDAPKRYGLYTPENFDRGFFGPVMAKDALIYSRNVPAVHLLARIGEDAFHRFLSDAGVAGMRSPEYYGLALALGGNEVTMQELVTLYGMLANGGRQRPLRDALALPVNEETPRLMSPEASFLVLDMLYDNPRPDALAFTDSASAAAWKTGTSYAYRDAWTVGVTGDYVLAVWVGNFDGSGNPHLVGRKAAAPLFFSIADALPDAGTARAANAPPPGLNLTRVDVCANTGDLPGPYCPETTDAWFIPGVSPIRISDVHRAVRIDAETGLRACRGQVFASTRTEIYEFWPSDLDRLFRQAGIGLRRPPPYAPGCALDERAAEGNAPNITSPDSTITYQLRPSRLDADQLGFAAVTDADVESLYWFVDQRFVAEVERGETFFWRPEIGDFTVSVVDDQGRASSRDLHVRVAR